LGEKITAWAAISIFVLIVAVCLLSLGARGPVEADSRAASAARPLLLAAGIAAACLAGFAYAVLGVVIRYGVTGQASLSTTLVTVGLVGVVGLGAMSVARIGTTGMWHTSSADLGMMLLAGVCNAAAFLALTKALQLAPIVYVNAMNATQAAMAFLAGALLFWEPITTPMVLGLCLTVVGLVLMRGGKRPAEAVELLAETPHAAE
jgi:drug/metabolite transporter, DME family